MKNVLKKLNKLRNEIENEVSKRNCTYQTGGFGDSEELYFNYKDNTLKLKGVRDSLGLTIGFLTNYLEEK